MIAAPHAGHALDVVATNASDSASLPVIWTRGLARERSAYQPVLTNSITNKNKQTNINNNHNQLKTSADHRDNQTRHDQEQTVTPNGNDSSKDQTKAPRHKSSINPPNTRQADRGLGGRLAVHVEVVDPEHAARGTKLGLAMGAGAVGSLGIAFVLARLVGWRHDRHEAARRTRHRGAGSEGLGAPRARRKGERWER